MSPKVLDNLGRAYEQYCADLQAEGKVSDCNAPDYDFELPQLPKAREWLQWSNFNMKGEERPIGECPVGQYITSMQWREQVGYGLVDMRFTCSGTLDSWQPRATNVQGGSWKSVMQCGTDGFREVQVMVEEITGWNYGIVKVKGFCSPAESLTMVSNNYGKGSYDNPMACSDGEKIVCVQVRHQTHHGIINFKVACESTQWHEF